MKKQPPKRRSLNARVLSNPEHRQRVKPDKRDFRPSMTWDVGDGLELSTADLTNQE